MKYKNAEKMGRKETREHLIETICSFGGNNPDSPEIKALFAAKSNRELTKMLNDYNKKFSPARKDDDFSQGR